MLFKCNDLSNNFGWPQIFLQSDNWILNALMRPLPCIINLKCPIYQSFNQPNLRKMQRETHKVSEKSRISGFVIDTCCRRR